MDLVTAFRNKCTVTGCKKMKGKNRTVCYAHAMQRRKEKDPLRYSYYDWKANAKRRGKEFTITLEQFREFAQKNILIKGRGITATSYHIDRIKNEHGYHIWNIQLLQNTDNINKENLRRKILKYEYQSKTAYYMSFAPQIDFNQAPF